MKILNKQIKLLLALAFVNVAIAQNTTGTIEIAKEDGLYEISLPNKIRSFSNRDLSDFRILDSKGKEVAYFVREKRSSVRTSSYAKFEIHSNKVITNKKTSIIFKNPYKVIEEIILTTANYSGSKNYKILGSNHLKQWYGVLNNGYLSNINAVNNTSIDNVISFPKCNYKYLKIEFNDVNSLPINVLQIGNLDSAITNRELQNVAVKSMTTVELVEEKRTQIHITFENKEVINQLHFKVVAPEFFNRNVIIYKKASRKIKNKEEVYNKRLTNVRFNSDLDTNFTIPEIFEDDIYIEVENKDSNSLSFAGINFYQKPLYVISSLKANEKYTVQTGRKTMDAPEYDLSFFKHNISENLPRLEISNVLKEEVKQTVAKEQSFWQQPWFMWVCIVLTGLIIIYFSSSLVKDLKKQ
ncbi:hypothetical protein [Lacinutrix mariniflava]|uniref:hypothetical protein n=1 Tax=Lacinutrix mariniflava TaxID=342955 RepID=UPI0006E1F9FB|nr:hypothetical protein [Lacinutrix mariniflava]